MRNKYKETPVPTSKLAIETAEYKKQKLLDSILNGEQILGEIKKNLINMIEDELDEDTIDVEHKVLLNHIVENLYDEIYWKADSMHKAIYGITVRDFYNYIRKKTPEQLGFSVTYKTV